MKMKILIAILVFTLINNFLFSYDVLKQINKNINQEVFIEKINPSIKLEKEKHSYIKTIYKYIVFYIFYFDIDDYKTIIEIRNY